MKKNILITFFVLICSILTLNAQTKPTINLKVEGMRNTDGHILVQVVDENLASIVELKQQVIDGAVLIAINDIAPGTYGIRICHDEDDNDEMTNNWIGLPKEGFGYSWDKKVRMKEPDFEEYAFTHNGDQDTHVSITLQYL